MTEESNMICHYCRCDSEHMYTCSDCDEVFCLTCVPVEGKAIRQVIRCPRCNSANVVRNPETAE